MRTSASIAPFTEVPDHDRIGRFRSSGESQTLGVRPLKVEDLAGGEMGHGRRRSACDGLLPDISYALHTVDEGNRAAIRRPRRGSTESGCGQFEGFRCWPSLHWNDCRLPG